MSLDAQPAASAGRDDYAAVARAFADRIAVDAAARDERSEALRNELVAWADTGLLTLSVPARYGGPGLSYPAIAETVRIVAAADGALAQLAQSHFGFIEALRSFGTESQRRFFFGRILAHEVFGNAQAEGGQRGAGGQKTRLLRHGEVYRLVGDKVFTTGSFTGDWIRVSAQDEEGNFVFALLRRDTEGIRFGHDWDLFGQRGTASMSISFDNVLVPREHVLRRSAGQPHFLPLLATFQLTHAAIDIGIGRGALEAAGTLVRQRSTVPPEAYARGLSSMPQDQHVLVCFGQWDARQTAAELLLAEAAHRLEAAAARVEPETTAEAAVAVSRAKAFGADVALEIATELFTFAGARSTSRRLGLDRFWRNLRVHTLHDANWWKYAQIGDFALTGAFPPVIPDQ